MRVLSQVLKNGVKKYKLVRSYVCGIQTKDVSYLNVKKAKNTIKTKYSSIVFSSFISAISWLAFLLFYRHGCWLDS